MVAMQVLSAAEMQACDRATTERFGIPSIQLMRCGRFCRGGLCAPAVSARAPRDGALRKGQQRRRWHDGGAAARRCRPRSDHAAFGRAGKPDRRCRGGLERIEQSEARTDPRRHECQGAGHAQRCARRRPDCGRGVGHGVQAAAEGTGAGGARVAAAAATAPDSRHRLALRLARR